MDTRQKNIVTPAALAGRCANGYERGQGSVIHAVLCSADELRFGIDFYARSLCGKTHGARSAGWSSRKNAAVTCKKCLKAIAEIDNKKDSGNE